MNIFKVRSELLEDVNEVSKQELHDVLPQFKNYFANDDASKIKLYNKELFKGYKGVRHETIFNPNLGNPSYGTTYETNLPEQAYTFEYPAYSEGTFNPLQMHLTGRANYERMKKGGTLPITAIPENFNVKSLIRQRSKRFL